MKTKKSSRKAIPAWLRKVGSVARQSLVELKMYNKRVPGGEITTGQGKMCSYSGNQ